MKAFHNDPAIKEKYLARVKAHREADQLVKGEYWEDGKGCAVGCTIHSGNHKEYEIELGIPEILAHLEDTIFEGLPNELAMTWPERFLKSIPVGADLSKVWPKFAIFLLTDKTQANSQHEQCGKIAGLYEKELAGEVVDWAAAAGYAAYAANASYAAVRAPNADAAYAAAAVARTDAAAAAAYAAAVADADAFADAATYAARATAYEKARIAQSEKLLELLAED